MSGPEEGGPPPACLPHRAKGYGGKINDDLMKNGTPNHATPVLDCWTARSTNTYRLVGWPSEARFDVRGHIISLPYNLPEMTAIGDVVQQACGIPHPSANAELVPYYPLSIALPGFVKNDKSVTELLVKFGSACAVVLGSTWIALRRWKSNLKPVDRGVVLWFVLTGGLHTLFEGYYVIHHTSMAGQMDLMGQLWKEYALSDSRYLTKDTFVLSIETITALVWGPLSFCTAAAVAASHPMRHSLQTIVSMAHIYGCALYFATATVDSVLKGSSHSRPEFVYFWVYYFGMNFVFIAIPSVLIVQSLKETRSAFAALDEKKAKKSR